MNLRQLEIFHALMVTGSTTAAARRLNVSQPNISNMIKHLESQLGMELFRRARGKLIPTREAQLLFPGSEHIFERVRALMRMASDLRGGRAGALQIVASPALANAFLPAAIENFRRNRPEITININVLTTKEVVERIERCEADLGITYASPSRNVESLSFAELDISCVLRKDHPLAKRKSLALKDLQGYPIVTYPRSSFLGLYIDTKLPDGLESLKPTIYTSFAVNACMFSNAGQAVSLVDPTAVLNDFFPDLIVRNFIPRIPATIKIILPVDKSSHGLSQFIYELYNSMPSASFIKKAFCPANL